MPGFLYRIDKMRLFLVCLSPIDKMRLWAVPLSLIDKMRLCQVPLSPIDKMRLCQVSFSPIDKMRLWTVAPFPDWYNATIPGLPLRLLKIYLFPIDTMRLLKIYMFPIDKTRPALSTLIKNAYGRFPLSQMTRTVRIFPY